MTILKIGQDERDYKRALNDFIDQLFKWADAEGWSWANFADEANLAHSTVYLIGDRVTTLPRFKTVYLLARAVGARLEIAAPRARVKVRRHG